MDLARPDVGAKRKEQNIDEVLSSALQARRGQPTEKTEVAARYLEMCRMN
jgi:hypothetical protein